MLDSPDRDSPITREPQASDGARGSRLTAMARSSLGFADEAASNCDYVEAIAWISVVEGVGYDLPDAYRAKRDHWRTLIDPRAPAV